MKTYCSGAGCLEKTNRIPCIFALQRFRFWPDRWAVASPFRWSHWKLWNDHLERTSNGTWLVETSIFFSGKSFSIRYGDIFAGYFGICQPWNWQKLWCTEISGTFIHLPYCDLDEGHEWFCWFYPHLICAHWYFPWVKKKHVEFYVHTHTVTYICICIYIYIHVYATHTHIYYTIYYILYTYIWHMNATILIGFPDVTFPKGLVASHDGCSLARSRFSTTGLTPPWTNHLPILSGSIASLLCLYTFCRQIWKQYFPFCFQPVKPSDLSSKQMLWWVLQLDIFTLTDRRTPALPPHDSRLTVIRPVEVHTTQGAPHLTCQPLEQTVLWQPVCKFIMMTQ